MTAIHLTPLEAYRRDVERRTPPEPFGADDGAWLLLAHVLSRAVGTPDAELVERMRELAPRMRAAAGDAPRAASNNTRGDAADVVVAAARALAPGSTSPDADALIEGARAVVARMEEAGALTLAALVLSLVSRAAREAAPVARGRLLAQWALVERRLGELDTASDLYQEAGRIGRRVRSAELQARAQLGLGIVARERGNYPEARARFRRALRGAERAGLAQLTGFAHEGLMIAAAVAEDFDAALRHGWSAFAHAAGAPDREADVLTNLGTLCLDIGENSAALGAFLGAAERTAAPRIAADAWAGAAVASARLGDRRTLERLTGDVVRTTGPDAPPYEAAQHLLTLSDAWEAAGEPQRASTFRARGLAIARPHAFAELVHRYAERPAPPPQEADADADAAPLTPGARQVVRRLTALAAPDAPPPRPSRRTER